MPRNHDKLKAFHLADEFAFDIYKATRKFPKSELFGLVSQMRRAAVSIPANIVEGCARRTHNEYLQYLNIAAGSLAEVGYYVSFAFRLNYLDEKECLELSERHDHCSRTLHALIIALNQEPKVESRKSKAESRKPERRL